MGLQQNMHTRMHAHTHKSSVELITEETRPGLGKSWDDKRMCKESRIKRPESVARVGLLRWRRVKVTGIVELQVLGPVSQGRRRGKRRSEVLCTVPETPCQWVRKGEVKVIQRS